VNNMLRRLRLAVLLAVVWCMGPAYAAAPTDPVAAFVAQHEGFHVLRVSDLPEECERREGGVAPRVKHGGASAAVLVFQGDEETRLFSVVAFVDSAADPLWLVKDSPVPITAVEGYGLWLRVVGCTDTPRYSYLRRAGTYVIQPWGP
jgi:hypothetical protein